MSPKCSTLRPMQRVSWSPWSVISVLVILLCGGAAQASEPELEDLSIRYVNQDVLTLWDVRDKVDQRKLEHQQSGKPLPATRDEWIAFAGKALEDLTDDQLLFQRAKDLGISINHDAIVLEVLGNAKRAGAGLSLRDQAFQRRLLERQRTIDQLLRWLGSLQPDPTPAELNQRYQGNQVVFDRPARAKVLQLSLRVAGPEQRNELRKAKAELLRRAQDATDPAIKAVVDQALAAYVSVEAKAQSTVLDQLCVDLAGTLTRADLEVKDRDLAEIAKRLAGASSRFLDREIVERRLGTVRLNLTGRVGNSLVSAFQESKRQLEIPLGVEDQGMWQEPGTSRLDEAIFSLHPGEVSDVIWIDEVAYLVAMVEQEAARRRTYDEVSGELDQRLRWERRKELEKEVVQSLRNRASIHDLVPLKDLLRQVM